MRANQIASTILACTVLSSSHQLSLESKSTKAIKPANHNAQTPLMSDTNTNAPGIQLPPTSSDDDDNNNNNQPSDPPKGILHISDVIGTKRQINIFAGFTRDIDSVSRRLDSSTENSTILAPVNSAISALPRKPWEDPREYAALGAKAYEGKDGEDRAHRNLRRFTEAHIVPESPWTMGERVKSLGGNTIWWEDRDGKSYVQPGNVEVDRVVSQVNNGEVWVLKGVLNYAN